MKMSKASKEDMDAAFKLCQIMDAIGKGHYPPSASDTEVEEACPTFFDEDNPKHLRFLYDQIKALENKGNLTRVVFGFQTAMDNNVFDPNADILEWHPSLVEAVAARNVK